MIAEERKILVYAVHVLDVTHLQASHSAIVTRSCPLSSICDHSKLCLSYYMYADDTSDSLLDVLLTYHT